MNNFHEPSRGDPRQCLMKLKFGIASDVLSRNTTWTFKRDNAYGFNFGPTLFYDGQGMMVTKDLGQQLSGADTRIVLEPGSALRNLNGAKICVQAETTSEANLADFFRRYDLQYTPVLFKVPKDMYTAYDRGSCSVATSEFSQLLVQKTTLSSTLAISTGLATLTKQVSYY
jgi:general L-amino acid transport system substrate-binding protein